MTQWKRALRLGRFGSAVSCARSAPPVTHEFDSFCARLAARHSHGTIKALDQIPTPLELGLKLLGGMAALGIFRIVQRPTLPNHRRIEAYPGDRVRLACPALGEDAPVPVGAVRDADHFAPLREHAQSFC
jgi:hypothetical protein